jgi:hypothetical protein
MPINTKLCEDITLARFDVEYLLYVMADALETFHYEKCADIYQMKDICYGINLCQRALGDYSQQLDFLSDEEIHQLELVGAPLKICRKKGT